MTAGKLSGRKLPTTFWIELGMIAFSIYLYVQTSDYPGMSGMLPRLVLIMIGVASVVDLIQMLHKRQPQHTTSAPVSGSPPDSDTRLHYDKVFYLIVLMPVYYIFLRLLGVILGTFVYISISAWILGYRKSVSLLVASAIVTVSVYLIFVVIMKTFLPQAILIGLIGG